jgi:hypothetical protein
MPYTDLEEFLSMRWRTCMHPFPYPSLGAHLPAVFFPAKVPLDENNIFDTLLTEK